ncbi:MAG TPA: DUF2937 family protein [Wenzhouxiangella sp.]|nr:DUF2937 family protein [Wenzhouxiangella sp.]
MSWAGRKLDNVGSALGGAAGGMSLSQAPAFVQAYLQRLGGHLDEARRTLDLVERGILVPELTTAERSQAVIGFADRVAELESAFDSIAATPAALQPLALLRHGDSDIAQRAWEAFSPALPLDPPALIWTGAGIVLALMVYEIIKAPFALIGRRRHRPT